ncbi:box H/ACA snoRNP assembly protein Shq1 [Schizosaccharomyces japonicus yFS275]|uniref:Box H/ACA snoRNP assembly protein Shq1 n=1 Tax=Schizosaccharomyces japonicus (strain yFS275 / FY16936) TaxID=402676 RepID=B6K4J0_SCHJY|nr:box H/ACA snoRNP assembly protein Shq1 [Schizosaccharomyces japonicus yFS275]EEB08397.1 box H/ACA snoRNP assembly protein Shq1 [Schizosaccharomyces japonicus yFS275]
MITPTFTIRQDNNFIFLDVKAPFIKAANVEIVADGNLVSFCINPYFLKLELPGRVIDDENAKASYDVSEGVVHVQFPKETPGEDFPNLDMLSTMMVKKESNILKKPLIQEMDAPSDPSCPPGPVPEPQIDWQKVHFDDPDFDWGLLQRIEDQKMNYTSTTHYGFNDQYSGFLKYNALVGNEVNDLEDPERTSVEERKELRIKLEDEKFDPDYYLADFFDSEQIDEVIKFVPEYRKTYQQFSAGETVPFEFTEEERRVLMQLPRREYLISNPKKIYLNLIELIFAYAYDHRTTYGEPTTESAWTTGKLAVNISSLDNDFNNVKQVAIACARRSLTFPLYRNWSLFQTCWEDTFEILRLGRRYILRTLLAIRNLFEHHDVYHIYNRLLIDDYAYWCQTANDNVLLALAQQVKECHITKSETGWELDEIERSAVEVEHEGQGQSD